MKNLLIHKGLYILRVNELIFIEKCVTIHYIRVTACMGIAGNLWVLESDILEEKGRKSI